MSPVQPVPLPQKPDVEPAPGVPMLAGRVDAIDGGRLYGWAFDRARPGERVKISVLLARKVVAEVTADRHRSDLRRNGVGDGSHAFDVQLPQHAVERARELEVVAQSPSGEERVLHAPSLDEQAAEQLISAPLGRVLDRLEVLMNAQRQLQLGQRALQKRNPDAGDPVSDTLDELREDLDRRLSDLEVYLMRFDGVVAGMEARIEALAGRRSGETRLLPLLLAGLIGLAAGVGGALVAVI